MILGRPTNLVLGAFTAVFNVVVLVVNATQPPPPFFTPEIVAAINIAAAALITLIAGQAPTVNQGDTVNVVTPAGQPNKTIQA